jgi:hypothetical protein
MGEAIPTRHPQVVLRSQFNKLRALLAVAAIAVAGLTIAVVMLANDNGGASRTSPVAVRAPLAGSSSGTVAKHEAATAAAIARPGSSSATVAKHEAATAAAIAHPGSSSGTVAKHEAATAAAIGQSDDGTVTHGSKTDSTGPASLLR